VRNILAILSDGRGAALFAGSAKGALFDFSFSLGCLFEGREITKVLFG